MKKLGETNMPKKKVCMFFNDLALYRKAIYKMLDEEYDCDWYIEDGDAVVKEFAPSELKHVVRLPIKKIGSFYKTKDLNSLLKKEYDIYFMLGATRNISLVSFCLRRKLFYPHKKIYFWTHGYYGKESWAERVLWKRPMFKLADGIFTYGEYAKKLMVKDGFKEDSIYPIHNSLDYDEQLALRKQIQPSSIYKEHFNNTNPTIIFIGRLTKVKKLDLLLEAVSLLNKKEENYNVVLVGDGVMRAELEERTRMNGIDEHVWFYGECYDEKMSAELIYNADLCVAPGNIGLTAMHVLMFGCPAISHGDFSMQMPEFEAIIPKETGDFFEYDSIESLADTISNWLKEHQHNREAVREACYNEIDTRWNPVFQMSVINENLK